MSLEKAELGLHLIFSNLLTDETVKERLRCFVLGLLFCGKSQLSNSFFHSEERQDVHSASKDKRVIQHHESLLCDGIALFEWHHKEATKLGQRVKWLSL